MSKTGSMKGVFAEFLGIYKFTDTIQTKAEAIPFLQNNFMGNVPNEKQKVQGNLGNGYH